MIRRFENPFDEMRKAAEGDKVALEKARAAELADAGKEEKSGAVGKAKKTAGPLDQHRDDWARGHERKQENYEDKFEGKLGPDKS